MRHVADAAPAFVGFERAVEYGQMFRLEAAGDGLAAFLDILDRVMLLDVCDDAFDFRFTVTEPARRD
jgi:hypothetical protein